MCGFVCELGRQIQCGLVSSSGNCGIVHLKGLELPPAADRFRDANLPDGAVKIRTRALDCGYIRNQHSKWTSLKKGDLSALKSKTPFERHLIRAIGPVIPGFIPMVGAPTNYNRFKALVVRVFRRPPPPEVGIWEFAAVFRRELLPDYDWPPGEMDFEEWIESMPASRRRALREAQVLYQEGGWRCKFQQFKSFLKMEALLGCDKVELDPFPLSCFVDRLIQAPHDVTHVIAGRKIKPFLPWLKKQWSWDSYLFYAGTKPVYVQLWLDRVVDRGPSLYFWSDYSMFDSSHNLDTWKFVEDLYRCYSSDPDFKRVLEAWRVPNGTLGDLKYQGQCMNASGRDDTALANALLNGFAMFLSVAAAWYDVDLRALTSAHISHFKTIVLLSVCGDDALGCVPFVSLEHSKGFCDRAKANISKFGFKAKFFASERLEDCVYLGHRPLPVAGRYYWSRTIGRCLYKLGWQVRIRGDPQAHMRGIMEMHAKVSAHTPILSDIATAWIATRPKAKRNAYVADPDKPWENLGECGPGYYDSSTLQALARAYTLDANPLRGDLSITSVHITEKDVRECIASCKQCISLAGGAPCVLGHWLLQHMCGVDEM